MAAALRYQSSCFVQDFRVDGGLACGAGGFGGLVQGQERVDGLLRPRLVQVRAGLGDRDEFPQHVGTAQGVACDVLEGVVGLPGVVDGDAGKNGSTPAAFIPSFPRLACTVTSTNFPATRSGPRRASRRCGTRSRRSATTSAATGAA